MLITLFGICSSHMQSSTEYLLSKNKLFAIPTHDALKNQHSYTLQLIATDPHVSMPHSRT